MICLGSSMAEIICIECKTPVSDASGYCPECGYPFDTVPANQSNGVVSEPSASGQKTIVTTPLDIILRALDSVRLEMNELRKEVSDMQSGFESRSMLPVDNTSQLLAEIARKLDMLASDKNTKDTETQVEARKKTKKGLLAAFYKTLNSPNSMFEYMFYICVVQMIFVIVNLFLVTYIVTLVR